MSGEDGYSSSSSSGSSSVAVGSITMAEQDDSSDSSRSQWIVELEDFCSSEDLSLNELQRMTRDISPGDLAHSFALHRVCMNEKVTLEVVEYLLHLNPLPINSCEETEDGEQPYPLHLACYNKDCPMR